MQDIEATASDIIDVALKLHKELGPGLLESVYEATLGPNSWKEGMRSRSNARSTSNMTDFISRARSELI